MRKGLLGIEDLNIEDLELILDTATHMQEVGQREVKKVPTLRGRTVMNLFFEPSTRTRTSFEVASKRLSADVVNFAPGSSSITKSESILDTAKTLDAMGPDAVVIRHSVAGVPKRVAEEISAPVINAGDGANEHPTQALLDMFTIREAKGRIEGLTVTIVGDIAHSRVARSDIYALTKMGAKVRLAAPLTMLPVDTNNLGVESFTSLEAALPGTDVVMALRIQTERIKEEMVPSVHEYISTFGIGKARLGLANEGALLMHPGPVNWGVELSPELVDYPFNMVLRQVRNGVAIRMAALYLCIGQ